VFTDLTQRTTNLENKKLGGGVLVSLNDLSQEVKTTMTGGNVAVVGLNSVNNISINEHQITPNKQTKSITLNKTDLPIFQAGAYMTDNGLITNSVSWNIRKYTIPTESKGFILNDTGVTSALPGYGKYSDGTYIKLDQASHGGKNRNAPTAEIYINENVGVNNGYNSITVYFEKEEFINEYQYNVIGEFQGMGYIKGNVVSKNMTYSYYKITPKSGYKYKCSLSSINGYKGSLYKADGTFIKDFDVDSNGYITTTSDTGYILVNVSKGDYVYSEKVTTTGLSTTSNQNFRNNVSKPFTFNGKTALYFGDSITTGATSGSTSTPNNFPKLFSDKVGLNYTNKGVSGALFTSGFNGVETIPTTIKTTPLNTTDIIFIAGGTNDYGLGVSLSQFETSISDICSYLKANFTGKVVFIAPINRVTTSNNQVADLQDYRNIIGQYSMMNGFSFIDGGTFNFPSVTGTYSSSVFGDGLHPSETGYKIYANALSTILL
jgi:lysophospholipase L1-like esterase